MVTVVPLGDRGLEGVRGVEGRGQASVGAREPEFLGEVRPAHAVVVGAAPVLVHSGLEGLHGEVVLELPLCLGVVVEVDAVAAGDVVEGLAVRVEGGRQHVEGQVLAAVRPDRVSGDPGEQFVAGHEFDDAAGLEALPGVGEPGSVVLVPGHAPAGELPVGVHHGVVGPVGGAREVGGAGELGVLGGLAEALGDVHVVPAGRRAGPVGTLGVHLGGEVEEERVAGPAVEPHGDVEAVAPTVGDPAAVEGAGSLGVHEAEEPGEERDDPLVAAVLLVGAQRLQQGQEGPEVGSAVERGAQSARAEEAVALLGGQDGVHPLPRPGQRVRVARGDRQRDVSAEPVGKFFPGVALRVHPAGGREVEEVGEALVSAAQAVELQPELTREPATGGHTAGWQLPERVRLPRLGAGLGDTAGAAAAVPANGTPSAVAPRVREPIARRWRLLSGMRVICLSRGVDWQCDNVVPGMGQRRIIQERLCDAHLAGRRRGNSRTSCTTLEMWSPTCMTARHGQPVQGSRTPWGVPLKSPVPARRSPWDGSPHDGVGVVGDVVLHHGEEARVGPQAQCGGTPAVENGRP